MVLRRCQLGPRFRVQGLGFRVWGFRVQGFGFRVYGRSGDLE